MNPAEFDNIARSEQQLWWFVGMNRILFRMIERHSRTKPVRVLEGGCGTGWLSKQLQERFGWRMYPLDLGSEGLRYARRLGLQRLVQADLSTLPFESNSFDLVLSMDVLVHFPRGEERRAVQELARVLKPGGEIFIRTSALDILRSRHSIFAHERQRFTRPRLVETFESAGIEVDRCTYANSVLIPAALAKFRVWEPLTNAPPASGVEPVAPWLNSLLYLALHFEQWWLGSGLNFPAGQSLLLVGRKRPDAPVVLDNSRAHTSAAS
jgi:SAM-dependent methyltransferase